MDERTLLASNQAACHGQGEACQFAQQRLQGQQACRPQELYQIQCSELSRVPVQCLQQHASNMAHGIDSE